MTNSKRPVNAPDDLKGLKMRTMENPVHIQAYKAFGIIPTPMAFTEVFTALQQGTVDGQENPLSVITAAKFEQVQKHLSLTGHVYSPALLLMNKAAWDKLSAADKQAFTEAAKEAVKANRARVDDDEKKAVADLRGQGHERGRDARQGQVPGHARARPTPSSARSSARTTSTRSATPSNRGGACAPAARPAGRRASPFRAGPGARGAGLYSRLAARRTRPRRSSPCATPSSRSSAAPRRSRSPSPARCWSPPPASACTRSSPRFVFQQPAEWSEVLIRFTLIWMVFMGAPAAFRQGAMVCVDLAHRLAGPTGKRVLDWIVAHRARWSSWLS